VDPINRSEQNPFVSNMRGSEGTTCTGGGGGGGGMETENMKTAPSQDRPVALQPRSTLSNAFQSRMDNINTTSASELVPTVTVWCVVKKLTLIRT